MTCPFTALTGIAWWLLPIAFIAGGACALLVPWYAIGFRFWLIGRWR